ncbi:hypothetical protein [Ochrobactrum sp. Marseille-Q0166]|uniref:hypothetical protein n=1 Tax=Ochrobactrum sp. Marseille-Q0166 TaxID=2761105 RepID=UPI00165508B7|nr:hypothetical protein [Ochrobactrum sp. Marseille-Q0166]MBC8718557.1 hypothetical protein [Ochrobactrum sp. Marseille-Q0166]
MENSLTIILPFFGGTAGRVEVDNSAGGVRATAMQFLVIDYEIASFAAVDALMLESDIATLGEKPIIRVSSVHDTDAAKVATIFTVLARTDGMQKPSQVPWFLRVRIPILVILT